MFKRAGLPFAATFCAVVVSAVNFIAPGSYSLQLPVLDCKSGAHAEPGALAFVFSLGALGATFWYFGGFCFLASAAVLAISDTFIFGG